MNSKLTLSFGLASISIGIFYGLIVAVTFLSNADHTSVFDNTYWTNGAVHLAFFEAEVWQRFNDQGLAESSLLLFVNTPSILWFLFSCTLLFCLDKKYSLSLKSFAILALTFLSIPYLWGVVYFNLFDLPPKEAGPVIAFMWLSILYLILPLSVGLIRKIYQQTSTILA